MHIYKCRAVSVTGTSVTGTSVTGTSVTGTSAVQLLSTAGEFGNLRMCL